MTQKLDIQVSYAFDPGGLNICRVAYLPALPELVNLVNVTDDFSIPPNDIFPQYASIDDYLASNYDSFAAEVIYFVNLVTDDAYYLGDMLLYNQNFQNAFDDKQDQSDNLDAFSALTLAAGSVPYGTGSSSMGVFTISSYVRGLMNTSNLAAMQTGLGMVNPDWNATTGLAAIANKPSIPAAQVQSDWNETNSANADFIKNKPTIPSVVRTTSTDTQSLVGTGATGAQISATKDSTVRYNVSTSTTVNVTSGTGGTSAVALKICSTNNVTEASWTTVAILENDQTIGLALALSSAQVIKGQLCADVPAGWYVKLVNSGTGTHSEAFISGQKTIYG